MATHTLEYTILGDITQL